jgi:hypothetical protein
MAIVNTPRQLVLDAAAKAYRKEYESAQRQANASETDEQHAAAIARLHRANEKYDAARAVFEADGGRVVV